jgi:MSHA biogenesis protein MshJ
MKMPSALTQLAQRLDARARRERLLLAGTILVVLVVGWDMIVRAPLSERHAAALDRVERLEAEIASLRDSRDDLRGQLAADGADEGVTPEQRLRRRIDDLDTELQRRTARLVSPEQMVGALRDVVDGQAGVRLVRLENTAAESIIRVEDAAAAGGGADIPRVYRHGVEVVVEGRYLDVLEYLQRLEALEWRFGWDALAIETTDYPVTRATVSLSTLSLAEDWIGV